MVDVFRAGTAHRPVDRPVSIESKEVGELALVGAALGLSPADLFARVLDHFAAGRYEFLGENAPAVYLRFRQPQPETGVLTSSIRG